MKVKSENVFIFAHPQRGYVAKLGDFSSSSTIFSGNGEQDPVLDLLGYTPIWVAPEYKGPARFSELVQIDVFAFGLLVWTIVCNGFRFFMDLDLSNEERLKELNDLKRSQKLLEIAISLCMNRCGDVDIEKTARIFVHTLREPSTRKLSSALDILKR